jgi:hypothetical protein
MFKNAYGMSTLGDPSPPGEFINQYCSSPAQHWARAARSVDPSAGNGRIVLASTTPPEFPAVSVRTPSHGLVGPFDRAIPEKGPGVTIFINGEKRCPGTPVHARAIPN